MRKSISVSSHALSPFQQVFEASSLRSEEGLNIEQIVCTSNESLNLGAFRNAWQRILDQHPSTRVALRRDEGDHPTQEILASVEMPLTVQDCRSVAPAERDAFVEEWLERDRAKGFNLSIAPLMRVTVLGFADNEVTWVWTFHHILMDGRSFLLVLDDFFSCYEALVAGCVPTLPERAQFAEFITWQKTWIETHRKDTEQFWREWVTNEATNSVLSISRGSPSSDKRQVKVKLTTENGLTANLVRVAADFDLTVSSIIQGAWALLLSHYYQSGSVTFATVRACRRGSIAGADSIVGLLMNAVPAHARIADEMPVLDLLKAMREQQIAVRSYQWTPWDVVRSLIPVAASKQFSDSCIMYERYDLAQEMTDRYGKGGMRTFALRERANIPLFLSVSEKPEVRFALSYQSAAFAAEDIVRLTRSFLALVHHIVETPGALIGDLGRLAFKDEALEAVAGSHFPLSALQQSYMEAREEKNEGAGASHYYREFERGELDVPKFQEAWQRLIGRHDILRSRVSENGEGIVLPGVPLFEIAVRDLSGLEPDRREQELTDLREKMSHRSYDPHRWPWFDLRISKLAASQYRLHFSFDLLMLDEASIQRLLAELGGLYLDPDQAPSRLPGSFRDFAISRQSRLEGKRVAEARAYWECRLANLAGRPALPLAADPEKLISPRFTRYTGKLSAREWRQLRTHAGKLRVSATAFLATAFSEVLGKWCNQRRFTLNLTRLRHGSAGLGSDAPIGNLTATTLLEINLEGADFSTRATDLMIRLRRDVRQSSYDGVEVLQDLRKRRLLPDGAGMPIAFTSLLGPKGRPVDSANRWLGECFHGISQDPHLWLNHQVVEDNGELVFHWDAIAELFPAGLIDDMHVAYGEYLRSLASLSSIERAAPGLALPPRQKSRREKYNATSASLVSGLLHAGFFEMAKKNPEQIAIDDPKRKVTYGELAGYAYLVARRLRKAGIGEGNLVAVVMEKGWEQIASVLGILRAGAAYLPIDPELPAGRLEYLLANGQVDVAFSQGHLLTAVAWPSAVKIWTVETNADPAAPYEGPEPSPDSMAYVIYTSGSTGIPKGVVITHAAALNTIIDVNQRLEISAADRVLCVSALTFDLSVYDIFGLLEAGGTLVLPSPERSRDPRHWIERMNECGVTIWNSAPALMQMLATVLDESPQDLFGGLRWAMLSGDWIPIDLPARIARFAPGCRILSLGGATEVSIWSIAYLIDQVDPSWTSIPYGLPMANQTIHVLDDNFQPCPEWTAGEIFIGGVGLAIGYLGDQAKTEERFLKSPVTNEMLYRTGDFGRFRPEGFVEFLGRKDTQVKIRGFRIEIGEVEASLLRLTGVREAAALTFSSTPGDRAGAVLVGCIVLDKDSTAPFERRAPNDDRFRVQLAKLLPAHMIPSRIVVLEKLPLSPNGKVDRAALLKSLPALASANQETEEEPEDLLERAIWRIWQEILPGRPIGRNDRFYDIGGDSLSVLHMITRIEKMVGRTIGLRPMQIGGTIAHLAEAARESGPVAPPPMIVCTQPGTKPPLFFAHGDLANGGLYTQRLAPKLGTDQPLYVISPHGSFGEDSPATFEEIASNFVELIRSVQPRGPYHLGGFCNGALAMYEAAQQLTRAGETVTSLVLLDPPDLYLFLSRRKMKKFGRFVGLRDKRGRNTYQRIAEGLQIWQDKGPIKLAQAFFTRSITWTLKTSEDLLKKPEPKSSSQTDLNVIYYDAMTNYEPQTYSGAAFIILREGEQYRHARQRRYWGGFMPAARFEIVPGTHLELRENMKEIGDIIQIALGTSKTAS